MTYVDVTASWHQPHGVQRVVSVCRGLARSPQPSALVQASPSSQAAALLVATQPSLASQLSVVHGFLSSQPTALPWQAPAVQVSPSVHGEPSLQLALVGVATQAPDFLSQLSAVQPLASSHDFAAPTVHRPPLQLSAMVQASPSASHEAVFAA